MACNIPAARATVELALEAQRVSVPDRHGFDSGSGKSSACVRSVAKANRTPCASPVAVIIASHHQDAP